MSIINRRQFWEGALALGAATPVAALLMLPDVAMPAACPPREYLRLRVSTIEFFEDHARVKFVDMDGKPSAAFDTSYKDIVREMMAHLKSGTVLQVEWPDTGECNLMAVIDKRWYPGKPIALMEVWIKRGGANGTGNSGPSGRQTKPAARMHRALAEMAAAHGVVNGIKKHKVVRR